MSIEAKSEKFWGLVDKSAEVKRVLSGFIDTQGPVFSRRGYLLFSDIPSGRILRWERGQLTNLRADTNKANGLTFDHQGRLIVAEAGGRVTRTEKDGRILVLAGAGPKTATDVVYAIDGSIYFSDAAGSRVYQITRERGGVGGNPPKGEVRIVAESPAPTGIALSPNQQQLYSADAKTGSVKVHEIQGDGRLKQGREFASLRAQGLKTDEAGNIWVAGRDGIYVYDGAGKHLGTIGVPEIASNCCWGEGFRGLYITARTSVYHVPTKVPGTRTF
jgi:gluconolactonase